MKTETRQHDWGIAPYRPGVGAGATKAIAALVLILFVGAATLLLSRFGLFAVGVFDAMVAVAVFLWVENQGLFALRSVAARALPPDEQPRLHNIAAGLASDLRTEVPSLFVIERGGPNAMACRARGGAIAITRSLLDTFTRTELEAVVAHCLYRLTSKEIDHASYGLALGPLGRTMIPRVGYDDDVRAASLTRFPPALAAAVEKAEPALGRFRPLWFVAKDRSHRDPSERATAIRDL